MGILSAIQGVAGLLGGIQQSAEGGRLIAQGKAQRQQAIDNSKAMNDMMQKALASVNRDAGADYANFSHRAAAGLAPTSYNLLRAKNLGVSPGALAGQANPQYRSEGSRLRDEAYRQAMTNAYADRQKGNFEASQQSNQGYANVLTGYGNQDYNQGFGQKSNGYNNVAEGLGTLDKVDWGFLMPPSKKEEEPDDEAYWTQDRDGNYIPPGGNWSRLTPIQKMKLIQNPKQYPGGRK